MHPPWDFSRLLLNGSGGSWWDLAQFMRQPLRILKKKNCRGQVRSRSYDVISGTAAGRLFNENHVLPQIDEAFISNARGIATTPSPRSSVLWKARDALFYENSGCIYENSQYLLLETEIGNKEHHQGCQFMETVGGGGEGLEPKVPPTKNQKVCGFGPLFFENGPNSHKEEIKIK